MANWAGYRCSQGIDSLMNVLYVTQYFSLTPIHASAITTYEIVRRLVERGHNVTVVSPCSAGTVLLFKKSAKNPYVTYTFPFPRFRARWYNGFGTFLSHTVAYIPLIINALVVNQCHGNFDIVVSMHHPSHMASFSAYLLSRVFKLPLIIKTHDVYSFTSSVLKSMYLHFLNSLHRVMLKRAERVLVVSNYLKFKAIETHRLEKHKVLVFPNGVDVRRFRLGIDSDSLRSSLGVVNKKVILFIGGITEDRGLDLLVKALPKMLVKNPNVIVLFVGEGPQKAYLKKLAQDVGVERFVKFVPPVSHKDIPRYISLAEITVGPLVARSDTFGSVPRKVLEYMACAKPVVSCRGGVAQDLIIDGYNGFLIQPGDVEELASIISEVFNDPSLSKEIGLNARKYVEDLYDWDRIMDDFEIALRNARGYN